jgi:hypothetical protein
MGLLQCEAQAILGCVVRRNKKRSTFYTYSMVRKANPRILSRKKEATEATFVDCDVIGVKSFLVE